ncbi:nuclear transport factor 2 family protein [Dyella sp. Tek66A03]
MRKYVRRIDEWNAEGLRDVFHPNARVEDVTAGAFRSRSADVYMLLVASR